MKTAQRSVSILSRACRKEQVPCNSSLHSCAQPVIDCCSGITALTFLHGGRSGAPNCYMQTACPFLANVTT